MPQRLVRHYRSEIRPTDADIDDIADRFPGVAFPLPAAYSIGKVSHLVEHGVHLGHHVLAILDDGLPIGSAQGDMQDGSLFGDVDFVAAEQGDRAEPQSGFPRQLEEEVPPFCGYLVLLRNERDADSLEGEA